MTDTMANRCQLARTFLFVPGNRPERFEKAARSGADAVILDLEDSVPSTDKAAARAAIERDWAGLSAIGVPLIVRISPLDSVDGEKDLSGLLQLPGLAAVMVPKAESAESIARAHDALDGLAVLPIIETVAGLAAVDRVASAPGVMRLAVGHIDFMADAGFLCDESETELVPLRFAVAMATRAHRLAPAVDGVTVQIGDEARLRADTRRALHFGFGGKLCIHPNQVAVVHDAIAPTEQESDWARRVIAADAASGGAAVQLDGRMVDLPVVLQARRTLARARGARE